MQSSSQYDEKALLVKCAAGDEAAFRELFMYWHQLLAGYLYRITESRELTEDLVQEVFMKIWMARETLSEINNFKHFLLVVSRNKAFDVLKKQLKEQSLRREWEKDTKLKVVSENEESEKNVSSLIDQAIDNLPPRRREVYLLSRHERLSYKEIAAKLGISKESVKTHLKLAISSMTEFIHSHLLEGMIIISSFFRIF